MSASLQPRCKYGENDPESPRSSLGVLGSNLNGESNTSTIDLNMCSIHLHLTGCRWDCLENKFHMFHIYIESTEHLHLRSTIAILLDSTVRPVHPAAKVRFKHQATLRRRRSDEVVSGRNVDCECCGGKINMSKKPKVESSSVPTFECFHHI